MKHSITMLLLAFSASALCRADAAANENNSSCEGIWAAKGEAPFEAEPLSSKKLFSPDRMCALTVSEQGLSLSNGDGTSSPVDALLNPPLTEVLWAADSRHFAVTASDGGAVGTWRAKYFSIATDGALISHDIQSIIGPSVKNLSQCDPPESPNVGVIAWLDGGSALAVVAEVPPHSYCKNMGTIFGIKIDTNSGQVIERLSGKVLRKKWKASLGCRFSASS